MSWGREQLAWRRNGPILSMLSPLLSGVPQHPGDTAIISSHLFPSGMNQYTPKESSSLDH